MFHFLSLVNLAAVEELEMLVFRIQFITSLLLQALMENMSEVDQKDQINIIPICRK